MIEKENNNTTRFFENQNFTLLNCVQLLQEFFNPLNKCRILLTRFQNNIIFHKLQDVVIELVFIRIHEEVTMKSGLLV